MVRSVSGPVILAGDFNTSPTAFDDMKALLADGWLMRLCLMPSVGALGLSPLASGLPGILFV